MHAQVSERAARGALRFADVQVCRVDTARDESSNERPGHVAAPEEGNLLVFHQGMLPVCRTRAEQRGADA